MAYYTRNRIQRVSEALAELRYTEMQSLSRALTSMASDRDAFQEVIDPDAMADLLADWSESTEIEITEALNAAEAKQ